MLKSVLTLFTLALAGSHASPLLEDRAAATVTMTFSGGPASYSLTFPANGTYVYTYNNQAVSHISATGIKNIYSKCRFLHPTDWTLVKYQDGSLDVGPPQPVQAVSCKAKLSDQCLPDYADCEFTLPGGGITIGNCCSGYCAATKCRPTTQG